MGYDISYHPIKESEINEWYFDVLGGKTEIVDLAERYGVDEFYAQKYRNVINAGLEVQPNDCFDKTHGYYIAVVQGFFRTFYYTRGSAFSFLKSSHPEFADYTRTWQDIIRGAITNPVENQIVENYSSGVYIPADGVVKLLSDYSENKDIADKLNEFYTHNIVVFLKALENAKKLGAGLLEATEVVEPNPLDLNRSSCYSNLLNCDTEGALLYAEVAARQIREIEESRKLPEGTITGNVKYVIRSAEATEKEREEKKGKSIWKKLFGK